MTKSRDYYLHANIKNIIRYSHLKIDISVIETAILVGY